MNSEHEKLQQYLEITAPKQQKHMEILDGEQFGEYPLIHVSKYTDINKFEPAVSRRTLAVGEDRTIPRVCVSPYVWKALSSMGSTMVDFDDKRSGDKNWKGGYMIYGFRPAVVVRPSKQLVADAPLTDEMWLLRYSPTTQTYQGEKIGKVFLHEVTSVHYGKFKGSLPTTKVWYIEVFPGKALRWSQKLSLKEGYYRITEKYDVEKPEKNDALFSHAEIDRSVYLSAKGLTADMLSRSEPPPSMRW